MKRRSIVSTSALAAALGSGQLVRTALDGWNVTVEVIVAALVAGSVGLLVATAGGRVPGAQGAGVPALPAVATGVATFAVVAWAVTAVGDGPWPAVAGGAAALLAVALVDDRARPPTAQRP